MIDQIRVEFAGSEYAGTVRRNPQQRRDALFIDREKRFEHCRHENGATSMWFEHGLVVIRIRLARPPLIVFLVELTNRIAQGTVLADGFAELLRELSQQTLRRKITSRLGNLLPQHFREREMLEQRYDVGECFVEGKRVAMTILDEATVHAVEQRVRGFVRD